MIGRRLAQKDKRRARYLANREQIIAYNMRFYQSHREEQIERCSEFYRNNKEVVDEWKKTKVNCPCSGKYTLVNKATHCKSKKHERHHEVWALLYIYLINRININECGISFNLCRFSHFSTMFVILVMDSSGTTPKLKKTPLLLMVYSRSSVCISSNICRWQRLFLTHLMRLTSISLSWLHILIGSSDVSDIAIYIKGGIQNPSSKRAPLPIPLVFAPTVRQSEQYPTDQQYHIPFFWSQIGRPTPCNPFHASSTTES